MHDNPVYSAGKSPTLTAFRRAGQVKRYASPTRAFVCNTPQFFRLFITLQPSGPQSHLSALPWQITKSRVTALVVK
ncbi:hypothetical protein CCR75_007360 [Bremia lactucae]|uniref:Uncharacterized protein n=1 Tax=Bremia lactucae TaxID=4779 RepID=A0A976FG10_BRELC|nr:hypothetical protein CCR75_007360 [Bremia lactucae]